MSLNLEELASSASGITANSREVKKGFIFVALRGVTSDGHDFIPEAIQNGAKVVVGEKEIKVPKGTKYVKVIDARDALGVLASSFYGNSSKKLKIIGVTGTKGKTTTAHLIYHILTKIGKKVGLVSSIMAKIGEKELDTGFHVTTPDVVSLQKLLKEMVDKKCEYAVLEVSSHAITQKRIAGVTFDTAVLTNIAPEHLDYHKTFSEYKKTKLAFLNAAEKSVVSPKKTSINVFPGEFNNINAQAAVNAVKLLGLNEKKALSALTSFQLPEGRMEEVDTDKDFKVFIDFAHTPDSLEAVLSHLRTITKGKLISVFGCAGERDPSKREKMGEISSRLADLSVFTAEDPRSESVFDITDSMKKKAKNYKVIPERAEAMAYVLSVAKKGDTIGFFGKGHEKSMAYEGFEHPWSDKEILEELLKSRYEDTSVIVLAAGMGTRMKSHYPKVIHKLCGRPMLAYTLESLRRIGVKDTVAVVNFKRDLVKKAFQGAIKFAVQSTPKGGTADAVKVGLEKVSPSSNTIVVINGDDSAFYKPETINDVLKEHKERGATLTFVSLEKSDPEGLGRVVRDKDGSLVGIIEEKDATDEQRKIKEVNDGLYVFDRAWLTQNIKRVKRSPISGEYYLVNLIKIALNDARKVFVYKLKNPSEWQGINTPEELSIAEAKMKERLTNYAG